MMVIHDGKLEENTAIRDPEIQNVRVLFLTLSRSAEGLTEALGQMERISQIEANGTSIEFIFEGTDEDQHQLLKQLLNSNWPVCALAVRQRNLQETYLEKFGANPHAS
jgi:hypothetical protein